MTFGQSREAPPPRDQVTRRGGALVPWLAVSAIAATVPVVLAALTRAPTLAQPLPAFPAPRPISALLVWTAASSLIALWRGSLRVAQIANIGTIALAAIGFAVATLSDVRMLPPYGVAFSVATAFLMFAAAMWLLTRSTISPRALIAAGAIGATLLALSGVLLVVTLGGMLQTDLARRMAQMSLTSLMSIIALSVGLARYVAAHEAVGVAPPRWLPVVVGASGALIMVVFWQTLVAREATETSARAAMASDAVQRAVRRQFLAIDRGLARVGLYAQTAPADVPLWRTSIERLTAETPGLERMLWLDSTGRVLRYTSDAALPAATLAQLQAWAPASVRSAAAVSGEVSRVEHPIEVRAIGQIGIALLLPMPKTAQGSALLVGLVSEQNLLRDFVGEHSNGFAVRALIGDSLIAGAPTQPARPVYHSSMLFGDRQIDFTFTPDSTLPRSTFPELLLLLGLAVAALVAVTLWLARKSWEQASVEGMSRMQRAIERATDGVWEIDLLRGGAHRSGALLKSLGYVPDASNALVSSWTSLVHPDDALRVSETMQAHIRGDIDVFECEYRVRAHDGSWHTIVDRGRVIERTSDGQAARLLGISGDITERARAAAEQEKSERRFRTMFDSAYQLQLLLDPDGSILEANRAAADFVGLSVDAMQGTAFRDVSWWNVEDGTPARVQERFDRARGGDATRFEVQTRSADGRVATIDFSLRPVRDGSEQVSQVLVEGHDLTERKRAEESLRQIGALTTMGQLAARVAHEINNPLAGIQNAFLLVRSGISTEHPHFRFVGAIEREIARIAAVTRQLYETYRPDQAGDAPSSVILAISDAVSFLEQVNRARQVKIITNVTNAPSLVPVPDALLRQTLYNLVQNALDASPPNGTIEVSASRDGDECVIRVCDEGPGIPQRIRDRIFEPFFSTKDRTIKTGGMGIGLSLVRQSVLAVGGQVHVHDRPQGGTEFEVRLPMQPIDTGILK